jgi:penicillin amidase
VPNVYYQNHLACPEFDAIGLSFPGVPGFPHFGHNQWVAWCVTHTNADYQDLYLERFDPDAPSRYEVCGQWREAETLRETIEVRDDVPVSVEITITHHGPIILGDPRRGYGLALRYTATAEPNGTAAAFLPMLRARSADEVEAATRSWVEPVNNLVFADVSGTIGYRMRGRLPVRASANAWLPVPGWDGAHEWQGWVPFEEMPAVQNPDLGFVVSANSRVTGPGYPHYIGLDYSPDFRTRRLVERLRGIERGTVADMAAIHGDDVSIPGREFAELLRGVTPGDSDVAEALARLVSWDGRMAEESVAATIYAVFRERLLREVMLPILGPLADEGFAGAPRGGIAHMARLRARLTEWIRQGDTSLLPPDVEWSGMIRTALGEAVAELRETLGPDVSDWRWGRLHRTQPRHVLSSHFPEWEDLLNPPAVAVGGDGDTVKAAGFVSSAGYSVTLTSVARYVFDLHDWDQSGWVVPLGVSGQPGNPHFADQLTAWRDVRVLPMRYDWARIRAEAESHQILERDAGPSS